MCLEEYTQEYVDELHKIELERFKKRADDAEAGREAEKLRADEAEIRADEAEAGRNTEKNRADSLAALAREYGIPEDRIAAAAGK